MFHYLEEQKSCTTAKRNDPTIFLGSQMFSMISVTFLHSKWLALDFTHEGLEFEDHDSAVLHWMAYWENHGTPLIAKYVYKYIYICVCP